MADINNSTNNTLITGSSSGVNNIYNMGNNVTIEGGYKYNNSGYYDYIDIVVAML